MKGTKQLSALEKLRVERIRLKAEEQTCLKSIDDKFSYLQNNLGTLLLDAGVNAVKGQVSPYISHFFGKSNRSIPSYNKGKETEKKSNVLNIVLDQALNIAPLFLKGGFKSFIVSILLKQVKNLISKKKG